MEGPQFSTRAESELHRSWGASLIGMTAMPEAKLAREAELCYAMVALPTDYDCWKPHPATLDQSKLLEEILGNVKAATQNALELIRRAIPQVAAIEKPCAVPVGARARHLVGRARASRRTSGRSCGRSSASTSTERPSAIREERGGSTRAASWVPVRAPEQRRHAREVLDEARAARRAVTRRQARAVWTTGGPSRSRGARAGRGRATPRCAVTLKPRPRSACAAVAPRHTTARGRTTAISAVEPGLAGAHLAGVRLLVDAPLPPRLPLEVLHGVGDVDRAPVDARPRRARDRGGVRPGRRTAGPPGPPRRQAARPPASPRRAADPRRRRSGCRAPRAGRRGSRSAASRSVAQRRARGDGGRPCRLSSRRDERRPAGAPPAPGPGGRVWAPCQQRSRLRGPRAPPRLEVALRVRPRRTPRRPLPREPRPSTGVRGGATGQRRPPAPRRPRPALALPPDGAPRARARRGHRRTSTAGPSCCAGSRIPFWFQSLGARHGHGLALVGHHDERRRRAAARARARSSGSSG